MNAAILLSPAAALLLSPLLYGIIHRTRAVFAGRIGPPLLQGYFDLFRLLHKAPVYSTTTSWIFRAAPPLVFGATLAATCFVPVIPAASIDIGAADLILLLYLLAFARFFLILFALDTGSAFEGMGASREAFFSALAEPVLLLCLLNALRAHGAGTLAAALCSPAAVDPVTTVLTAVALFGILLAENARIPFDDPATHLELTMIHEVMILDNSGPGLALLEYAAAIKLWLFSLLLGTILLPPLSGAWRIIVLGGLVVIIAITVGTVESIKARVRLVKIPHLLFSAGVVALMGFFISVTGALSR